MADDAGLFLIDAIPEIIRDLQRLGEMPDPGPFCPEEYAANAAEGAWWDAQQGIRKALRQIESGQHPKAVETLTQLMVRLPPGLARNRVGVLAKRLLAAGAALPDVPPAAAPAELPDSPAPAIDSPEGLYERPKTVKRRSAGLSHLRIMLGACSPLLGFGLFMLCAIIHSLLLPKKDFQSTLAMAGLAFGTLGWFITLPWAMCQLWYRRSLAEQRLSRIELATILLAAVVLIGLFVYLRTFFSAKA